MMGMEHAIARLGLDKESFEKGLASAKSSADQFSKSIGSSMRTLGATIAGAFAFDRVLAGFNAAIQKGDQLQDLANRFQVSASALQEIGNTASLSGSSLEEVASALNKLAKNAGDAVGGNEKLQQSFAMIGISVGDLQKMSPQDMFYALSDAVSQGRLGMEDFNVVTDLAGRSAGNLMETLRMGPDAIRETGQAMGVWADETTAALSRAQDSITKFQNYLTIFTGNVLDNFMSIASAIKKNPLLAFDWEKLQLAVEKADAAGKKPAATPRATGRAAAAGLTPDEIKAMDEATSVKDAARKRAMDSYQENIDQRNKDTARASAKWLEKAMENLAIDAKMVELKAENLDLGQQKSDLQDQIKNIITQAEGRSLSATRGGRQFMDTATKRQVEKNRQDDFKFANELAVNRAKEMTDQSAQLSGELDALRKASSSLGSKTMLPDTSGKTIGDRISEIEKSGLVDKSMGALKFSPQDAKRRMAEEKASRDNPSNREQTQTETYAVVDQLRKVNKQLEDNLKEMRTYAHVK